MIVCQRCKAGNSSWETACKACGLPFDAAMREESEFTDQSGSDRNMRATDEQQGVARGMLPDERYGVLQAEDDDAQPAVMNDAHQTLARLLGIEIEHVRALADAGIHTLEHIAESGPAKIALALRAWSHLDPAAIVRRARELLERE